MKSGFRLSLSLSLAAGVFSALSGCALMAYAATNSANSQNNPNSQGQSSQAQGTAMAYQYQFNAVYTSVWNLGWFGYGEADYSPGQGTVWHVTSAATGSTQPVTVERAYLRLNSDETQWWRLALRGEKGTQGELAYEFLVGTDGVVQKVRYKDPISGTIGEFVPARNDQPSAVASPVTRAQVESSFVGKDTVKVPAGSFTADHSRFTDPASGHRNESWVNKTVPGDLVKFVDTNPMANNTSNGELVQIEKDVKTALKSY